jgi:hypothetical protein
MVEMVVGMRKLGSEWTHRLESSSKDALTWVTSNEGSEEPLTVRAIALSLSHFVSTLWYFEFRSYCSEAEVTTSVPTASSQHKKKNCPLFSAKNHEITLFDRE